MADTVDSLVLFNGTRRKAIRLTNVSDGTGEAAVVKADISTYVGLNGKDPTRVVIEELSWNIQGFTSVRLFWDHTADDEIAVLTGYGDRSFVNVGGAVDPKSAGGTGDILLTTAGAALGATYDITVVLRLKD